MQRTTLATPDWPGLAHAFNTVYQGYVVPVAMNADQIRQHFIPTDIALQSSPLWLDQTGAVVALAALGVRGDRGWIGGFGVAPAYRGHGLSHALIAAVIETGRAPNLRQIQLEVLCNNPAAFRTYDRAGFTRHRDLRIFGRHAVASRMDADTGGVQPADAVALLPLSAALHSKPPCWQREPESIGALPGLHGLIAGDPAAPRGYALYRTTDTDIRISDVAAHDAETATALLAALAERLPGRRIGLSNEPADSPLCPTLERCGFRETLRQIEMIYRFD